MNKHLTTMLAATAVLGVTTAFAANPFSDVTPDSWAYQSVSQLAAAGVINGYPDGMFKGQNNITRYEMAQMVAKAMANQSRANAEQQAMINRLADEFSAELNNLGVRVSNLEKKVGNVKVTGDARLRYQGSENPGVYKSGKDNAFDYRGRIQFNATVNNNTDVVARVTTGNVEFGDATTSDVAFDRLYAEHRFGDNASVTAGRFGEKIGAGLMYDDTFDGAKFQIGNDKLQFEAGYGYFIEGVGDKTADDNMSVTELQLKGKLGDKANVGGFYLLGNKNVDKVLGADTDVYGFNADVKLGSKVSVGGEWLKTTELDNSSAWVAGVTVGNYDQAKKGSWDIKGQYFDQDKNAPILSSTFDQAYDFGNSGGTGYKGWMATVDYALAKNLGLTANYGFGGEDQNGRDRDDFYRAELNYRF